MSDPMIDRAKDAEPEGSAADHKLAAPANGSGTSTRTGTAQVNPAQFYSELRHSPEQIPWAGRGHFYAAAAQAMRRILIDHARSRAARGGDRGLRLEEIGDVGALAAADSEKILAVDAALTRLESEDPEAAAVVRLRFFAGLSVDQAAEALGLSPRSAARLWAYARAMLYRELSEDR